MRAPALDDVVLLALTVWGEARGESDTGKLAVAWVMVNRHEAGSISRVLLRPWQFSFWNTDDPSRPLIGEISGESDQWVACYKAACAAYFALVPDPTHGATNYLNVEATRRLRGGSLPDWYDSDKVTVVIDRHTFLKL